ncbi:MAG: DUF4954 family protein [Planctomycetes bacterium]|nr:DUF4954 family protein [Planctomycetota bacterium]
MSDLRIFPIQSLGHDFIEGPYVPPGKNEHYLRDLQCPSLPDRYRHLRADEIEVLIRNGNTADSWDNIRVTEQFAPHRIKRCEFYGLVRIGRLEEVMLDHHDMRVPVGITDSRIIACDFGDDVAVHHARYLAHYIIGDHCILLNVDEAHTTNHAKFGNGIIKEGESEDLRVWMDLVNEAGGRRVMPFDGMTTGDAYLWSRYRDRPRLMARFADITQHTFDAHRGIYGTIGKDCVVKNTGIIKDVKIGDCCYIKGANKLKNLTINSTEAEPTQIGEGVEMVNGIIMPGCHVFYGCKAVRFIMGYNSNLKYGARLIHSYLGDNSTVSCCEILNNLVFPAHEQHHNNSFLVASLIMGQSNIAAGATIGSNHNSRAPDGEVHAGRGFWPGLCASVKHNCRFASFTLLARGDYPAEMDIRLPFCLVSNDLAGDQLRIVPAWWWRHNMYALARNMWKFRARDKRKAECQHVEFDYLAPDTVEEIFTALRLLETWVAKAALRSQGKTAEQMSPDALAEMGRRILTESPAETDGLEVLAEGAEKSSRKVVVLKARQGYRAYRDMLHYYGVRNLLDYLTAEPGATLSSAGEALVGPRRQHWVNVGGQIVRADDLEALLSGIEQDQYNTWHAIHRVFDGWWTRYPLDKQQHAFACLTDLLGRGSLSMDQWHAALDRAVQIQNYISEAVFSSRKKDDEDPFRRMVYQTPEEMEAVLGRAEDNSFVRQVREDTQSFITRVEEIRRRG